MKTRRLLAFALISVAYSSCTLAAPKHTVQRGKTLVIETQFSGDTKVQGAFLTWQTFDYDPIGDVEHKKTFHHDAAHPNRKGMVTAFRCEAAVVTNNNSVVLSCTVPLDVADGNYYLTAISIRTSDTERKYSWQGDLPGADIEVRIEGGEELTVPDMKSLLVKQSS